MEALVTKFTRAVILAASVEVDVLNVTYAGVVGCNASKNNYLS